jgi:hypothetical protein
MTLSVAVGDTAPALAARAAAADLLEVAAATPR